MAPLIACLLAAAVALAAPGAAVALDRPGLDRAAAAVLVDARDGAVLLRKDSSEQRAIASATKLMTALLALERADPSDVFRGTAYRPLAVESKIGLRAGEAMRVDDLLEALLLESANDAAVALAAGISGSRQAFVDEMNRRAAQLGLAGTRFSNPIGLDSPGNHSTAADLAALSRRLLRDRRFAAIVRLPSAELESGARPRTVRNRNDLVRLGVRPVDGIKTGYTLAAGYVLVGSASAPNGARLVSVVLGEPSEAARDADTLALLRWGVSLYRRVSALRADRPLARARVAFHDTRIPLVAAENLNLTLRRGQRVARRVEAPLELEGPMAAGTRVGTVVVEGGGRVERVALVTGAEVPEAGALRRAWRALASPLTALALLAMLVAAVLAMRRIRAKGGVPAP